MNYPTMANSEPIPCRPTESVKSIRNSILETTKNLYETRKILSDMVSRVINVPGGDDQLPETGCLNEETQVLNILADQCRNLALQIEQLLF